MQDGIVCFAVFDDRAPDSRAANVYVRASEIAVIDRGGQGGGARVTSRQGMFWEPLEPMSEIVGRWADALGLAVELPEEVEMAEAPASAPGIKWLVG